MFFYFFFQQGALRALFAKTCGNYNGGFDSCIDTLADDWRDARRRRHDNREIDRLGNFSNAFVSFQAKNFVVTGIDRVELETWRRLQKVRKQAAANGSRAVCASDHSD